MSYQFPPDIDAFVKSQLASGRYASEDDLIREAFEAASVTDRYDVVAFCKGGGSSGQAGALRLGIARALLKYDADLRPNLKKAGLLTRDARIKERKKYGLAGARKRFQFSKR